VFCDNPQVAEIQLVRQREDTAAIEREVSVHYDGKIYSVPPAEAIILARLFRFTEASRLRVFPDPIVVTDDTNPSL
jgi:hypothetical protein